MRKTLAVLLALATMLSCLGVVFVSAEGHMRGDVDGNGELNAIDYMLVKRAILGTFPFSDAQQEEAADIDGDGDITETDYRLLKRAVLGTYRILPELPEVAEEEAAFTSDLQSSIRKDPYGKLIMTVVLTVKDIKEGVQMQELFAALHYDPEQLTLRTENIEDVDGSVILDCAVTLPGRSWENLSRENPEGEINIRFVGINPAQVVTAETPLELSFLFELKEGVTEATVFIPSDTVRSGYAPNYGSAGLTVYCGEGASTTAKYEDSGEDPCEGSGQEGGFRYKFADGKATVTGYTGPGGAVVIPSTLGGMPVTEIGKWAFDHRDDITSVTIPEGVKVIGDRAFWGCTDLTNVSLPNSLTTIEYEAFFDCKKLASIKIPDNVSLIGDLAFYLCESLTSAYIPKNTTEIKSGIFAGCRLTSLTVDPQNPVYYSDGNCIIERDTATLVQGCSASVIPQGIKVIGEYAFYVCRGMTDINIPFGVEKIERLAFDSCMELTYIAIPGSVKMIEMSAFADCKKLEAVTLGEGVKSIGWNAFYHTGLTSVRIPISVTEMSVGVFQSCKSMTDIYCEAPEKPAGWENGWDAECPATVHWGMAAPLSGDISGDGRIDSTDYLLLKRAVLGSFILTDAQMAVADVNNDGEINGVDYLLVKRHVLGTFVIE